MNLERIGERKGNFTGHEHNHAGQHSHLQRLDASQAQLDEHTLIEGNLPNLFEDRQESQEIYSRLQSEYLGRGKVVFEIGKRAMRRITRDGKR